MASKVKKNKINFKGKMVSIGIDMHKRSWRITALVEGDIVMAVTLARPNYNSFKKILAQFKGNYVRIAYEAGPAGFNLYDRLTEDGIECIVTPPSLIPTQSGSRVKTDKKDSLKLAKLLESNMLKKVWVLSAEERAHRQLVRTRRQIVNHRSDVMRQIKSLLLFHSIEIPFSSKQQWAGFPSLKGLLINESQLFFCASSYIGFPERSSHSSLYHFWDLFGIDLFFI